MKPLRLLSQLQRFGDRVSETSGNLPFADASRYRYGLEAGMSPQQEEQA